MTAAIIAASASIVVAVLAFVLNQYGQARQERRQARLARISSQLRDLYGPLNAMVDANERIWEALRDSHLPKAAERGPDDSTASWRRWRDEALQPANRRMRDLIFAYADLVVEAEVPEPLRDFCAHVAALEIVRAAESEEGARQRALIDHPGDAYVSYVRRTFAALKHEQAQLLRRSRVRPRTRAGRLRPE
ncbi:hypothetical protein [Micromonospora peucetia]|uniref:DUF4760 domain-containing protein n=1 Tax=Micromonospora peucetia TaxID=47871 RepID=A0ABZ1ELG6_9ACTN|nr:hypothetical protein [Micromonospora peucetia]WSA35089.1 hypothetical protein OIE14_14110 [Micromonospora peucetia]